MAALRARPTRRLDVVDDTFVAVPPAALRAIIDDRRSAEVFWPGIVLHVREDRGLLGVRWTTTGALVGHFEVWLEEVPRGTIVHHYVRGELSRPARGAQEAYVRRWKVVITRIKDVLEGRPR